MRRALRGIGVPTVATAVMLAFMTPAAGEASKISAFCASATCGLNFTGEIAPGDAAEIGRAILRSPKPVEILVVDSSGGDPFEAIQISDILNKYFVMFLVGESAGERGCASACALIYVTADQRAGTNVFLHRPTFPAAMFGTMSAPQAEAAYNSAVERLKAQLRQRKVPESMIERIMSIPSSGVEKLGSDYPNNSPWMDEWLASKCGSVAAGQSYSCFIRTVEAAQKQAQRDAQKKQ